MSEHITSDQSRPPLNADDVDRLESMIPLNQVPRIFPALRHGKRVNVATIFRWTNEGCQGVRLKFVKLGSTRCTTREWIAEFVSRLSGNRGEEIPLLASMAVKPTASSHQDEEEIDRKLDAHFGNAGAD